ncbi:MAG: DotU family type IV/VI secretion system protein [Roseomonas sp.]|nr:DotU family type IV/VI secretion system protein [Roseomonas sp.]
MSDLVPLEVLRLTDRTIRYGSLLRELMGFHALVVEARTDVEAQSRTLPADTATPEHDAISISERLVATLAAQWDEARRRLSERELAAFRDVQYLMCALADDLFLHEVEWRGREAWGDQLLEQKVFGTRVAGEEIFEQISALLRRRDPSDADLAATYLAAIGLGFKGRFRVSEDVAPLESLSRRLFDFLAGRAADPALGGRSLVPGAIANVIKGERRTRVSRITIGATALLGIAGTFVVVSSVIWFLMTNELVSAARAVMKAAE